MVELTNSVTIKNDVCFMHENKLAVWFDQSGLMCVTSATFI